MRIFTEHTSFIDDNTLPLCAVLVRGRIDRCFCFFGHNSKLNMQRVYAIHRNMIPISEIDDIDENTFLLGFLLVRG